MEKKRMPPPPVISNRRARASYTVVDHCEAGIVLTGPEVKSLRAGHASLQDSFARVERGEVRLYNMHIQPYAFSRREEVNPTRTRKLLLHRAQIRKWEAQAAQKGLTLIPLEVYFSSRGLAKVALALAKGKRGPDRRDDLKRRDLERETRKEYKTRTRI